MFEYLPSISGLAQGGRYRFGDGTAALPSVAFQSDPDTGFYRTVADRINFAAGGAFSLQFGTLGRIWGAQGDNRLELGSSGDVSLIAGGTNQNINLTPSGTGNVSVNGAAASPGPCLLVSNSAISSFIGTVSGRASTMTAGQIVTLNVGRAQGLNNDGYMGFLFQGVGSTANALTWGLFSNDRLMSLLGTGSLLLGTTTDSANGRIQLTTHTTSSGGIGFGTDTALHRESAGALAIIHTTNPRFLFSENGTITGSIQASAASVLLSANSSLVFRTGGSTTALTLDTLQNATFVGTAITPAGTTARASLRVPHGAAPTTPVNGDIWTTTAGLFVRINGVTVGPLT